VRRSAEYFGRLGSDSESGLVQGFLKNYTMTLNMQTIERIPLPPIN